jgi:hypothetical protein
MESMTDPRYPIGDLSFKSNPAPADRAVWIEEIAQAPALLRAAVAAVPPGGLDKPYRDGGWTRRQVVHHVADSHMSAFSRFRWTLTEDQPVIKPYDEKAWSLLADNLTMEPEVSLALLDNLHARLVVLLRSLTGEQWKRTFVHPESGVRDLTKLLQTYAWHGKHHAAHLGTDTQFNL